MFTASILLAISFAALVVAAYVALDMIVPENISYKRKGAIRFYRIGRLSGSFCYSKKAR